MKKARSLEDPVLGAPQGEATVSPLGEVLYKESWTHGRSDERGDTQLKALLMTYDGIVEEREEYERVPHLGYCGRLRSG